MEVFICILCIASALMIVGALWLHGRTEARRKDVVRRLLARTAMDAKEAKEFVTPEHRKAALHDAEVRRDCYMTIYQAFWGDES